MAVKRVVTNISTAQLATAQAFYGDVLGMSVAMDLGWIVTFAADGSAAPQISVATEGGSGTEVPDVSIEVDNVDEIFERVERARAGGFAVEYGPVNEPWGVRRFFVRDPFDRLINILAHVCTRSC
jgi:catechol 2,3-dioxygenase-like lactoylglutathione lyase family enzyme